MRGLLDRFALAVNAQDEVAIARYGTPDRIRLRLYFFGESRGLNRVPQGYCGFCRDLH